MVRSTSTQRLYRRTRGLRYDGSWLYNRGNAARWHATYPLVSFTSAAGSDATRMDAARNRAKSRKSKATFDKRTRDAMTALGTPYQFDDYHWQVRDGARVVLDLWTNNKGRVAWRWPDGGTIKGSKADLCAAMSNRSLKAPSDGGSNG